MHRAARQHLLAAQRDIVGADAHLLEHVAQRVLRGAVDHPAERAVLVVLADQRHRAREVRIGERGQRDQQLVGERRGRGGGHARILPGLREARAGPQPIPVSSSCEVAGRTSTTSTRARNGRPASGWLPSTVIVSPCTAVTTPSSGPRSVCAFSRAPTAGTLLPSPSMPSGSVCTSASWRWPKPLSGGTSTSKLSPAFFPASASSSPRTMPPAPCT